MVVDATPDDRPLACVLAALVDERDVLRGRADELPADIGLRVRLVARELTDDRADRRALDQVRERAHDIARRARVAFDLDRVDAGRAGAVLALAFPDRVAVRRSQRGQFQLRTGGGAWVAKDDPLAGEPFVVAADLDGNRTSARIRLAAGLDAAELEHALAAQVERRRTLLWDKQRNDLVERLESRLGNMVLADTVRTPEPGPQTAGALVERVRATRLGALDLGSGANLRARIALLRATFPDDAWPDWSDAALLATLDEWLTPYLQHATSRADLDQLDLGMLLVNQLSWDQQTDLAELTPAMLDTPAGRSTPIDYTRDHPTASVRVQDLFGTRTHPSVVGGRVPITLELLSPADRPIQVTADLPSFWAGSWAEVRKEMAGRYPKHQWPVDPAAAPPKRLKDR
jgi:ATP-dependent helicase HrpB